MKNRSWFIFCLMLMLIMGYAPVIRASSFMILDLQYNFAVPGFVDCGVGLLRTVSDQPSGGIRSFELETPLTAGTFSNQGSYDLWLSGHSYSRVYFYQKGTDSAEFNVNASIVVSYEFIQDRYFPFNRLIWTVNISVVGGDTIVVSKVLELPEMQSIVTLSINGPTVPLNYGTITFPLTWRGPGPPGWEASGQFDEQIATVSWEMTADVVPLPSTALLLGSALLVLAGWRKLRKS